MASDHITQNHDARERTKFQKEKRRREKKKKQRQQRKGKGKKRRERERKTLSFHGAPLCLHKRHANSRHFRKMPENLVDRARRKHERENNKDTKSVEQSVLSDSIYTYRCRTDGSPSKKPSPNLFLTVRQVGFTRVSSLELSLHCHVVPNRLTRCSVCVYPKCLLLLTLKLTNPFLLR